MSQHWLYPAFLDDPAEYAASVGHWKALLESSLRRFGSWQVWFDLTQKIDERDGNPIFVAVCPSRRIGVRVIQHPVGEADDGSLDWWVDFVGERTSDKAIRELVIACCPSRENRGEISRLFREWVSQGTISTPLITAQWYSWENRSASVSPGLCSANF